MAKIDSQRGFTLIELLVAMVIIGILSVIGIGNFRSSQMKARDAQRKSDLQNLSKSLEMYYNDKGQYPAADNGKIADPLSGSGIAWGSNSGFTDTTVAGGAGAIYMVKMPQDPAGNAYYYVSVTSGKGYRLYARLENLKDGSVVKDEDGDATTYSGTVCGTEACNYQVVSSNLQP